MPFNRVRLYRCTVNNIIHTSVVNIANQNVLTLTHGPGEWAVGITEAINILIERNSHCFVALGRLPSKETRNESTW